MSVPDAELDALYTRAFYEENVTNRHQYVALGDAMHEVLRPGADVLELGCGAGLLLERLAELGHPVVGLDGSSHAVAMARERLGHRAFQRDLRLPMLETSAMLTVICVEVAEHLPASAADVLVDNVTRSAIARIIWSAAPPGQGGVDHVNEQPPGYWLLRFHARGWAVDEDRTKRLRDEMWARQAQHCYARGSFWVLEPVVPVAIDEHGVVLR